MIDTRYLVISKFQVLNLLLNRYLNTQIEHQYFVFQIINKEGHQLLNILTEQNLLHILRLHFITVIAIHLSDNLIHNLTLIIIIHHLLLNIGQPQIH